MFDFRLVTQVQTHLKKTCGCSCVTTVFYGKKQKCTFSAIVSHFSLVLRLGELLSMLLQFIKSNASQWWVQGGRGLAGMLVPPGGPNCLNSMFFWADFGKMLCCRPHANLAPPLLGKSWICYCFLSISHLRQFQLCHV